MKRTGKIVLALLGMFMLTSVESIAFDAVDLSVGIFRPKPSIPPIGKGPVQPPSLWQDGHELSFAASHPACALDLVQNGIVVYSVDVDESTTSVVLPTWLTGEYELQLYPEDCDYYFYGYVTL